MTSRAATVVLLVVVASLAGAASASGDPPRSVASYYLAHADARLCPSPICGGIWVTLVNGTATCGDGARRRECYAAESDLSRLRVDEKRRVRLQQLVTEGRAVARGKLVRGRIEGFSELDVLVVSEVWTASRSLNRPRGVFHLLRDNGVRCVTTPCFSVHAARLNSGRHVDVSEVGLAGAGASMRERRQAIGRIAQGGLIASGRFVHNPNAGRTFIATQFYVRAPG